MWLFQPKKASFGREMRVERGLMKEKKGADAIFFLIYFSVC